MQVLSSPKQLPLEHTIIAEYKVRPWEPNFSIENMPSIKLPMKRKFNFDRLHHLFNSNHTFKIVILDIMVNLFENVKILIFTAS